MRYASPAAFRQALEARLLERARAAGFDVNLLRKQVAFERFLARLFRGEDPRWVLKGGYALELRLRERTRTTLDLDLAPIRVGETDLLEALREAAEEDLGDFFEFHVRARGMLRGAVLGGGRFEVEADLAGRLFERFVLDVGVSAGEARPAEWVEGKADLSFAGLARPRIAVCALEEQFADKLHAYTRPREHRSRVKDLVDLAAILDLGQRPVPELAQTVRRVFDLYRTHPLPEALPEPQADWAGPFRELARRVGLNPPEMTVQWRHVAEFYARLTEKPG